MRRTPHLSQNIHRVLLVACCAISVSHCDKFKISPDRSDQSRVFLDKPTDFKQFQFSSTLKSSDENNNPPGPGNNKENQEQTIENATSNGAKLLFRSTEGAGNPQNVQYVAKFLTEQSTIGKLTTTSDEVPDLIDLYDNSDEMVFPGDTDLGSYFFYRDARISGTSNLVFLLPTDDIAQFKIDESSWNTSKQDLQSQCQEPLHGIMIQSDLTFNLNDVSLQDFNVDGFLTKAISEQVDDGAMSEADLKVSHLAPVIIEKLETLFEPSIRNGNTTTYLFLCPDQEQPKAWKFNNESFSPTTQFSPQENLLTMVFEQQVDKTELQQIKFEPSSLLELMITGENEGKDPLQVFTRNQYVRHEQYTMPGMADIVAAINKAENPTTAATATEETPAASATKSAALGANAQAQVQPSPPPSTPYTPLQQQILNSPKRRIPVTGSYQPAQSSPAPMQAQKFSPQAPAIIASKQINPDIYEDLRNQVLPWNTDDFLSNQTDPFFSTVLHKTASVFYNDQGEYLVSDDSEHLTRVQNSDGSKTLLSRNVRMWNKNIFTNARQFSEQQVLGACQDHRIIRKMHIKVDLNAPRQENDPSYLTTHDKSVSDMVHDQFWVGVRRPSNDGNADSPEYLRAATDILTYGAFSKREPEANDPLKKGQDMYLMVCINPEQGDYIIFWKSAETAITWNEDKPGKYHGWKSKHVKRTSYIEKALQGSFLDDTPYIKNPRPWFQSSNQIHINTSSDNFTTINDLVQASTLEAPTKQRFTKRVTQSPSQGRVVCSNDKKKCFFVFQATFARAMNAFMMPLYITPPDDLPGTYASKITSTKLPAIAIYTSVIKSGILDPYILDPGRAPRLETTIYGAFELTDLEQVTQEVKFISFNSLQQSGIFAPSDPEINSDGTMCFVGDTPELYLSIKAQDASGL